MMRVVLVNTEILHRDAISLLLVSRGIHNVLISMFLPWRHINLERAKDIEDKHLKVINAEVLPEVVSLGHIQSLNLNFCQQISNRGVKDITIICPALKKFSFCDNERVTYFGIRSLVKNCKFRTDLNLSGCKNFTDISLVAIGKACHELESLNIARCDLITDDGVIAIAEGCTSLQSLSVFGIPSLTDRCLETLTKFCSNTLTALDVNFCTGIKRQSREELVQLYPNLRCIDISMDPAMQF